MTSNRFKDLFEQSKIFYKKLKKIRCKHIDNDFVMFSSSGFTHLLIKNRKSRPINEKLRRLTLLKYIPSILESTNPEIDKRILISKEYGQIEYQSISSKVNNRKIKIILRKIGTGNYHFWSIMDT